jgi:hypothetical protein
MTKIRWRLEEGKILVISPMVSKIQCRIINVKKACYVSNIRHG